MNKKYFFLSLSVILFSLSVCAQTVTKKFASAPAPVHPAPGAALPKPAIPDKPRLVVGIVVDQMRYDYLIRFRKKFGEGGFKRLLAEGFSCTDANYNYVPTYTAPGHACIYTGATPSVNGMISNEWFDVASGKNMYCVSDSTVQPVGTASVAGKMSPKNLFTTTITDELRLASNFHSKVIGVALKDRGAILPAGHAASGAYWHDPSNNCFVTSSYYMPELPPWVTAFNERHLVDTLLSKPWNTLLPLEDYTESSNDSESFEGLYAGEVSSTFPHDLPSLKSKNAELIRQTPFGNTLTAQLAMAAMRGESLGRSSNTDFLCVSFSSTDYVGHMFGINSVELEDTYLRLDSDIASLLDFIDKWVGKNNSLVFLTADHGAENNPQYAMSEKIPGGNFDNAPILDSLKKYLNNIYGIGDYISDANAHNIWLNKDFIDKKIIRFEEIENRIANFLLHYAGIAYVMTGEELKRGLQRSGTALLMQNGFNQRRSADILIELLPGWMDWGKTGTTHGSAYSYDTHVPLIFSGWKIGHGSSAVPVSIVDVSATVAALLELEFPSGNSGKPIAVAGK